MAGDKPRRRRPWGAAAGVEIPSATVVSYETKRERREGRNCRDREKRQSKRIRQTEAGAKQSRLVK